MSCMCYVLYCLILDDKINQYLLEKFVFNLLELGGQQLLHGWSHKTKCWLKFPYYSQIFSQSSVCKAYFNLQHEKYRSEHLETLLHPTKCNLSDHIGVLIELMTPLRSQYMSILSLCISRFQIPSFEGLPKLSPLQIILRTFWCFVLQDPS